MRYFSENDIINILKMSVQSTETMNSLDVDPDVIKARLKIVREISDGFNIDIKIPSNKRIMIKRIMGGHHD
jgi:hypothetical protein